MSKQAALIAVFSISVTGCLSIHQTINIKIMYRKQKPSATTLRHNASYVGDDIETKVLKLKANKEPIKDGAPIIYTDRSQGVPKPYDITTDRMEEALDLRTAMAHKAVGRRGANTKKIGKEAADGMKKEGETPPSEGNQN